MNTIAGGVDGAQLLQVVSGVAQTSEGLEHPLHSRVGPLRGQLLRVCTACQQTQMQRSKNLDMVVKSVTLQRHFVQSLKPENNELNMQITTVKSAKNVLKDLKCR